MSDATGDAAMSGLAAFNGVSFDWTRQLRSIWRDPLHHVPALHGRCIGDILTYFDTKTAERDPDPEPLGCVVVGPAGYGKTHLIGGLRQGVWERDGWFVLLDLVGVKDFWSSVALGFVNSLQVHRAEGMTQYDLLILKLAELLGISDQASAIATRPTDDPRSLMNDMAALFRNALARYDRQGTLQHRDVLTALIFLTSDDLDQQSIAHAWLQGMMPAAQDLGQFGFMGGNAPITVVKGLCWLMSLVGPTLIAVDQIDAIVTAGNARSRAAETLTDAEQAEARSIVEALAQGLMDLHEVKRRAVTVLSCLEATWKVVQETASVPVDARFRAPVALEALPDEARAAALVEARLAATYSAASFTPPYPTWPFRREAFAAAAGLSPRELLKSCESHRLACVARGQVFELVRFDDGPQPVRPPAAVAGLDARYAEALSTADIAGLLDPDREDDLRAVFAHALQLFERQLDLPDDVDSAVQLDPDQKRPSLHGRLSFTFHAEGEREQHYCFRLLGHANHLAFQSRIKAAMTASGIGTRLGGRHLILLRASEPPKGPKSHQLAAEFLKAGGRFIAPADADLRAFVALRALAGAPDFAVWLRQRKPLFDAPLFVAAGLCPPPFLAATTPDPQPPAPSPAVPGAPVSPPDGGPPAPPSPAGAVPDIVVGHRAGPAGAGDPVGLAPSLLPRHVAVFAGSGSGKTVLLRRLVEEAALRGMPAIVLDINNDLARLGDPWPAPPEGFTAEDARKAARYRAAVEVVVWTPGIASGNPLSLDLLPDFSAIGDGRDPESEDERAQAVDMARATLDPYVAGGGQKANERRGVLADALRLFARRGGGTLRQLVDLLAELPEGASEIGNAGKLAEAMANQLRAAIATNPLLRSGGPGLDPQLLFHGPDPERTRISVLNLSGLASEDAREAFVNQLQMTLFTWLKQHPSPTGRLYVLDEAQNFAPSQAMTACKASTRALAAQARKYGLGMVFATQLPRGIDNGIVSNCTTHLYGRMSAPATIQATRELMAAKGGDADDLARLGRGVFYFSTEGLARPVKIRTPLCLSHHPANPPTAEDVVARARASRRPPA
ncbi:ATP-binding protein [Xanthobacter dioxanivorans]|nr:ATP-binding protein [Xanthobacter dioxanivorans]